MGGAPKCYSALETSPSQWAGMHVRLHSTLIDWGVAPHHPCMSDFAPVVVVVADTCWEVNASVFTPYSVTFHNAA